jgi:hypothetical protein
VIYLYLVLCVKFMLKKNGVILDVFSLEPARLSLALVWIWLCMIIHVCMCMYVNVCVDTLASWVVSHLSNLKERKRKRKKKNPGVRGQRNALVARLEWKFVFHLKWQISKCLLNYAASRWIFSSSGLWTQFAWTSSQESPCVNPC